MPRKEIEILRSIEYIKEHECDGMTLEVLQNVRADCSKACDNPTTYSVQDDLTQLVLGDLIEQLQSLAAQSSTEPMIPQVFSIEMFDKRCVKNVLSEKTVRTYMRKLLVHVIDERLKNMEWYNSASYPVVKAQIEKYLNPGFANLDMTVETLLDRYTEVSCKKIVQVLFVFNLDQFVQSRKFVTAKIYKQEVVQKTLFHGTHLPLHVAQQIRMMRNPSEQKVSLLSLAPGRDNIEQMYVAPESIAGPYGLNATTGEETMVIMTLSCLKRNISKHNRETDLTEANIVQMMCRYITSCGPNSKFNVKPVDIYGVEFPKLFLNPIGIITTQTVNAMDIANSDTEAEAMFNACLCHMYVGLEQDKLLLRSTQSKFFEDMQRIAEQIAIKYSWERLFRDKCRELWEFFDQSKIRVQQFAPVCTNAHDWVHKVDIEAPSAQDGSKLRQYLAELHGRDSANQQKVNVCIQLAEETHTKIEFSQAVWFHMSLTLVRRAFKSEWVDKQIFRHNLRVYEKFTSRVSDDLKFPNERILSLLMLPEEGPLIFKNYFTKEWYRFLPAYLKFEKMLQIAYMAMHKEYFRARELKENEYRPAGERVTSVSWKRYGNQDDHNILKAWVQSLDSVWARVNERVNEKVVWLPQVSQWVLDFVKAFCMQVVNYQVTDGSGCKIRKDDFVKDLLAPLIQKLPLDTQQTIALHFIKTDANLAVHVSIKTAHDFSTIIEHDREKLFAFLNTDFRAMFLYITNTWTLTVQDCINLAQKYLDSQKQYSMLSQQHHDAIVVEDVPEDAAAHKAQNQNAVKFMHSLIAHLKTLDASLNLTAARLHFTTTQIREVCEKMNVELPLRQQKEVPTICKHYEKHCFEYELKRGRHFTVPVKIEQILASELPVSGKLVFKAFYAMISCTETTESELGKHRLQDFAHTVSHQFLNWDDLHFTFTPYERERFLILPLNVVKQKLEKLAKQHEPPCETKKRKKLEDP